MKNKEIEELLKGMRDVSNTEGCYMNLDRDLVKLLLSYIEQLENKNESLLEDRKQLLNLVKQLENNRDKAIEILDVYGTYRSETADLLYEALKGDSDESR